MYNLIFLFEKVLTESFEWRNCGMEGTACGDVVTVSKIEEKHIFFKTLRTEAVRHERDISNAGR